MALSDAFVALSDAFQDTTMVQKYTYLSQQSACLEIQVSDSADTARALLSQVLVLSLYKYLTCL